MTKRKKIGLFSLPLALLMTAGFVLSACGAQGPVGPEGPQGPQGPQGIQGPAGKVGKDAFIGIENLVDEEIDDGTYSSPGVETGLVDSHKGKFYPATATKAEADALADTINRQINDEGQVLLYNDGVLPLDSHDKNITLMGVASQEIVVAGGGSGSASQNSQSTAYNWNNAFAEEGFKVNPTVVDKYKNYISNTVGSTGLRTEMSVSNLGTTEIATYKGYNDAAVLVFYRWSQENADLATYNAKGHSNPNDTELDLQDNEKALIKHAKQHFDKVIVLVAVNPNKHSNFSPKDRVEMIEEAVKDWGNVEVYSDSGLTVNFARKHGATHLIRGLRAVSDFEYEFQLASANEFADSSIDMVFFMARGDKTFISSSAILELYHSGVDISNLVPDSVTKRLK